MTHSETNTVREHEDFDARVRRLWSTALDEETERRYGMQKHHPPSDCPLWFINDVKAIIRSHKSQP